MKGSEKILVGIAAILLVIAIVLGYQKYNLDIEIGAAEFAIIEIREQRIAAYDNKIDSLNKFIATLQTERDSIRDAKAKSETIFIERVERFNSLPVDEQYVFIANGLSEIDSIRRRYVSGL
tara:strand:+ start:391 stop:753 length:363 start_codon:yes stop_codon:yes gene_type:complete